GRDVLSGGDFCDSRNELSCWVTRSEWDGRLFFGLCFAMYGKLRLRLRPQLGRDAELGLLTTLWRRSLGHPSSWPVSLVVFLPQKLREGRMSNRQDMGTDKIGLQFQPLVSEPRRVEDPRAFQPSTKERGLAMSGLSSLAEMI